jgi:hypothetical protein
MAAAPKRPTAITSLAETDNASGKKNWLVYAESGKGKTVLAGTAPNGLFLTTEAAGTESAKAFGSKNDEWVCDDWATLQEAFRWLRDGGGCSEYDWVIMDSLSEMEELCWRDQLETAAAGNSSRSEFQAAIQDYAIVDNKIKKLVDAFNRLPVNVLYTAQVMNLGMEDEDGDDYTLRLPLVGRTKGGAPLSNKICGKVTVVGLLHVKQDGDEEIRRLITSAGQTWIAKDRHDTFGRYVDNPDIAEMVAAVDARLAEGSTHAEKEKKSPKKKGSK